MTHDTPLTSSIACLRSSRAARFLVALALVLVALPAAADYELWEIHTAGEFGGTIVRDGDTIEIPDDACGLRFAPAIEWHWGTSAGMPTYSDSNDTIWFFGGSLTGCGAAPYEFHTPVNAGTGPSNIKAGM